MVKFLDIKKITESFQPEIGAAIDRVLESGFFVRGDEVRRFENAYASFIGTARCVGTGNGFDALRLIFRAWIISGNMQEGDEVIVPANTYIASILAITENRLTPVLVEPDIATFTMHPDRIREKLSRRTRAIMVVHLYGRNAMHPGIRDLAAANGLKLVEDNAQATGCFAGSVRTGSLGDAAAHSFFPTKNLGALGDAGAITTDDPGLADVVRTLGNYGSHEKGLNDLQGVNSRLDDLQAAVLNVKLPRLDADNARRREAARFYLDHIMHPDVILPERLSTDEHVWHLFVVRCSRRDQLREDLRQAGIETMIHYPVPPHRQQAYSNMRDLNLPVTEQIHREVLSLPLSPVMDASQLGKVADAVNGWSR